MKSFVPILLLLRWIVLQHITGEHHSAFGELPAYERYSDDIEVVTSLHEDTCSSNNEDGSCPGTADKPSFNGGTILHIGRTLKSDTDEDILSTNFAKLRDFGIGALFMILEPKSENRERAEKFMSHGILNDYALFLDSNLEVEEMVKKILAWLLEKNIQVDGISSQGHRYALLKAALNDRLGLPGDGISTINAIINKDITQLMVLTSKTTAKYGIKSYSVESEEELQSALRQVSYPIVMKPLAGMGSHGAKYLATKQEAEEYFKEISADLQHGGKLDSLITYTDKLVVMEYIEGTLYSVTVAVRRGRLLSGSTLEHGRKIKRQHRPDFYDTTRAMPGKLSKEKQFELIQVAYQCLLAVGGNTGTYNFDIVWQDDGIPRLLEINPRIGGYGTVRFIEETYGVNLKLFEFFLYCKTASYVEKQVLYTNRHIVGYLPFFHRDMSALRKSYEKLTLKSETGEIDFLDLKYSVDYGYTTLEVIQSGRNFSHPCCLISVMEGSRTDSINKLVQMLIEMDFFSNETEVLSLFNN